MSNSVYRYRDTYGDRIMAWRVSIPKKGPGLGIRTGISGCAVPLEEIPRLIEALQEAAQELGHAEGKPCGMPWCGPCSFDGALPKAAS